MKRLTFLGVIASILFLFLGCESTDNLTTVNGNFIEEYNEIKDVHYILHKNIENYGLYLPKGNVDMGFVESYNLYFYIANNQDFFIDACFSSPNWLFIKEVVFLSDSGKRLKFSNGERTSEVVVADRRLDEHFIGILSPEEIDTLYEILHSDKCYVAYVGNKGNTEKKEIGKKLKAAIIELIDKYNEVQQIQ